MTPKEGCKLFVGDFSFGACGGEWLGWLNLWNYGDAFIEWSGISY
jgi:hypothetical protein